MPMWECMVIKKITVLRKKVMTRILIPLPGCFMSCQGTSSKATTQAGLNQEAIAANIRQASDAYSRAKNSVIRGSFISRLGLK